MSARELWVAELSLAHFRNYEAATLSLGPEPVCLFGANGAGKTNLLEALTCLAPGRGLRGAALGDLAQGGETLARSRPRAFTVAARVCSAGAERHVGVAAEPAEAGFRRIARLDGAPAASGPLARLMRMAWLTPAMDRLFTGPPADRRRFLDRLALARAPEHGAVAAGYERALRERARLLAEERADAAWLTALEAQMAAHGAALAAARAQTLVALQGGIAAGGDGAFPRALVALEGVLEARFLAGEASAAIEADFAAMLRRARARDAAAGRALEGPHRSDLAVRHAAKDMPAALCSTGEQKALLMGLVLAHARALALDPEEGPTLLLLDEAAAHLDEQRRAALFEELLALPGQAWLTGTDRGLFAAFGPRAQFFQVSDAVVRAAGP